MYILENWSQTYHNADQNHKTLVPSIQLSRPALLCQQHMTGNRPRSITCPLPASPVTK